MSKIIGITGGIATGKSIISGYLRSLGYPVINADLIGHEVLEREDVKREINERIGNVESDGKIDRKKLGSIVFSNWDKLKILNEITHPRIIDAILNEVRGLSAMNEEIFVEAAVLFEMGLDRYTNFIIVTDCPDDLRIKRIMERDKLSYDAAVMRIKSQMPREEYIKRADFVIDTSGDVQDTLEKVFEMLKRKPWCDKI
ncbi:dephospho-CoA kinase [Athalassotoga saccharophila]|uniref:dephospho-CoA kinase n=1 Tax=Athalassotoga saccharophila TaxID=1441386 RepID=UPI00137B5799|nr:dephospho-CoA kinase [Athalassotoga saccharophila]BBJ28519.1 dephospho-CoA kinase [Athalassotoga saccharophila]